MIEPLVSILIPAHNAEKTISTALHSCLNQTYENIEILVLNNASKDQTQKILDGFSDARIQVFYSDQKGISKARNFLVSKAQGKYIAWLDADDIAMPSRMELQTEFMEAYPEIDVLGTYANIRGSSSIKKVKWPCGNKALQAWIGFKNPFIQSSLMIKKSVQPTYHSDYDYMEDYHWLIENRTTLELQILPAYLCSYYQSNKAIKLKSKQYKQQSKLLSIWNREMSKKGLSESFECLFRFMRGDVSNNPKQVLHEIKTVFEVLQNQEERAILLYQAFRLLKMSPSLTVFMFCVSNGHLLPKAMRIRPKYLA